MSAHYGYFDIGVYKNDGTPDEAKAREVFAWIQTNCPWFYDENVEVFVLDGHRISNNADFFCDGLYQVKDGDVPDNLDFLDDAYKAVKAEKIAATFLYDGSETSWHNNFFTASVWADGKRTDTYRSRKVSKDSDTFDFPDFVSISPEELVKGTKEEKKPQVEFKAEDFLDLKVPKDTSELYVCKNGDICSCYYDEYDSIPHDTYTLYGCKDLDFFIYSFEDNCILSTEDDFQITANDSDYEYGLTDWNIEGSVLLDAYGKPIQSLKDFDHTDDYGLVRVPRTDFVQEKLKEGEFVITEEARQKFFKKFEKEPLDVKDGVVKKCRFKPAKSITIPAGVTKIGNGAFRDCTSLASVEFGGSMAQWEAVKGKEELLGYIPAQSVKCADGEWEKPIVLVKDGVVKLCLDKNAASVVIPAGVTEIGNGAFTGCTSLASVEIPAGVTKIGNNAFKDCTSLALVEIPAGVTEIAGAAFARCKALASIAFGGTVKKWKRIEKNYGWNDSCPIITVHCSDGDVTEAFGDGK